MLPTLRRSLEFVVLGWVVVLAALPAAAQNQVWIRQFGTIHSDYLRAAAPDGSGGIYAGGDTFGGFGGPNSGSTDAWLARYDNSGNRLWVRQLGTFASDAVLAIAPDGAGGAYAGGDTQGSLGGPNAGNDDAWLAHFDSSGNQLWIRQLGTIAAEAAYAVASDGLGGVYLAGETGANLGGPNAGLSDAWLAHYDSAGNQLWIRQFGTSLDDDSYLAAPDGSGGVFVGGRTQGSLGGPNAGGSDFWLARYDVAGNQLWILQLGTSSDDYAYRNAAPDGSGGVYVGGFTLGRLGGPNAGGFDAWFARYDGAGNLLWIRQLGTSSNDEAYAAAPDGSGGVYVGGTTVGSLGGPNAGYEDAWLARYDGVGNQLWIQQLGTSVEDYSFAAAPDGSGGVYVGGYTLGNLGGPNGGDEDAWIARYGSSATLLCQPGSGGVIHCPCSNPPSGPGQGCDNSAATGGATIQAFGVPSLAADTLAFVASGEKPTALSLLLQGTSTSTSGAVYGQGVRCVAGTLKRLFDHNASAGIVTLPDFAAGDPTISARSAAVGNPILAGQSRWYLVYYRDPIVLGGCPASSTFNSGPTMRADWGP
jgi:hypothetical protein